jgi:hypothetical protein
MSQFNNKNYSSRLFFSAILLLVSPVLFAQKIVESGVNSAGFSFNEKSSEPVIQYRQHIYMLAGIDDKPTLQVFADGRVVAHYPVYMKKAGDYEMQLDEAELEALIQSLSSNGLMVFDAKKVKDKIKQYKKAEKAKGQFHAISDAVESVIEIKLDEYQENNKAKKIEKFHKQFRWKNIEHDAARYKHDSEIIKANNSVTHLKGLMKDKRLLKSGRQ